MVVLHTNLEKSAGFHISTRLTSVAVWPRPAFQARLVSIVVTLVVAEEVVSWPAELVAAKAIVVLITAEADLKIKLSHASVVLQTLPLSAGVDHP